MLKVTKLSKYYGAHTVLNKISFNLERGNKVALTGFNGAGKTTLLSILAGNESYSNGVLQMREGITVGFVPQDPSGKASDMVCDVLSQAVPLVDDAFWRRADIILSGFGLPAEIKEVRIGDLSSGQKTKIFLTHVLLQDVDLLLLDEPTNNLDLPALIWLETYLQNIDAACMIVSHDRAFLDAVTNKVFEIDWNDHTLHVSNARYSDYLLERQREHVRLLQEHEQQQEEVQRLKSLAVYKQERGRAGSKWKSNDNDKMLHGFKQNRAGKSFKDAKVTYGRIKRMDFTDKPAERRALSLHIDAHVEEGTQHVALKDAVAGYAQGFTLGPVSLDIPYAHRLCMVGPNGVGKTTLLKMITGALELQSGERLVDAGVRFGNFMQEHESLPREKTVLIFMHEHTGLERELVHSYLTQFGFSELSITSPIKHLSPGGRARLLFALFAAQRVNVLILDEPTNHLDMEAEFALEEALKTFSGTVVAVSHDRRFVSSVPFDAYYILMDGEMQRTQSIDAYIASMEARAKKIMHILRS